MRNVDEFVAGSLDDVKGHALRALWHAAHGNWNAAHEEAQEGEDRNSAWVHALLHREEGDQSNAEYWYRRAGRPVFRGSIAQERVEMISALLSQ
ncbi:hypothetical protein [Terriglobus sp. TAA 43]|uniref:hypothetical protein n=1 Tax=Terriglobus sp. TAA 43 TaxID=278961 RepID=UPI00068DC8D8|nr:hypothetical protein [Terriglobus sp. TAA 43]